MGTGFLEASHSWMEGMSRLLVILLGAVMVLGLWTADLLTGGSLLIFLLIPLMGVARFAGLFPAACLVLAAAAGWLVLDLGYCGAGVACARVGQTLAQSALLLLFVCLESSRERFLRRARTLSNADPLTGAANGRAFAVVAQREICRQGRTGSPMSLAILDLDNFKGVNDRFGHGAGDGVLCAVAGVLLGTTRCGDTVARIGGDEFAILFPDTGHEELRAVLQRVREDLEYVIHKCRWPIGFSIGALTTPSPPPTVYPLLKLADDLMYESKKGGKNRTIFGEVDTLSLGRAEDTAPDLRDAASG